VAAEQIDLGHLIFAAVVSIAGQRRPPRLDVPDCPVFVEELEFSGQDNQGRTVVIVGKIRE
jgi:hypothetical protein